MSLWFLLAGTFLFCVLVAMLVHYAQGVAEERRRVTKDALDSIERFNEEARKPVRRGDDLVRAIRARARLQEHKRRISSPLSGSIKKDSR